MTQRAQYGAQVNVGHLSTGAYEAYTVEPSWYPTRFPAATFGYACTATAHRGARWSTASACAAAHVGADDTHVLVKFSDDTTPNGETNMVIGACTVDF